MESPAIENPVRDSEGEDASVHELPAKAAPEMPDEKSLQRMQQMVRMQRQTKCTNEINEVLKKYNCAIVPRLEIEGAQMAASIKVIAR